MITITIKTDNAAFDGDVYDRSAEVVRILRALAHKLENAGSGCCPASLYDVNGNKVGAVTLTGKDRGL